MSDSKEKHWTDNPELMERYVLNQLNAGERNELEDHLRVCEVCKLAVRAEQILIAGIRRSGREQLKSELAKKTEYLPESATPWGRILSAAAVVLILFTVGIYNRWFDTAKIDSNIIVEQPPSQNKPNDTSQLEREQPESSRSDAEEVGESKNEPPPRIEWRKQEPFAASRQRSKAKRETDKTSVADEVTTSEQPANEIAAQRLAKGAGAAMPSEQHESEAFWIQGIVTETKRDIALAETKVAAPETYSYSREKNERVKKQDAARESQSKERRVDGLRDIILQQADVRTLPLSQQANAYHAVQAKVERIGDATQLTMYFDTLIDEREFAKASVESQHHDSLAVILPNKRIAFYLPPVWKSRLQVEPEK